MKATEQYFPLLLYVMLYKVILIFVPVTQNPEVWIFIITYNNFNLQFTWHFFTSATCNMMTKILNIGRLLQ